jgi:hypothetical protein
VTIGAQTSFSAVPTNQFSIYEREGGKDKAGIGEFYNN